MFYKNSVSGISRDELHGNLQPYVTLLIHEKVWKLPNAIHSHELRHLEISTFSFLSKPDHLLAKSSIGNNNIEVKCVVVEKDQKIKPNKGSYYQPVNGEVAEDYPFEPNGKAPLSFPMKGMF